MAFMHVCVYCETHKCKTSGSVFVSQQHISVLSLSLSIPLIRGQHTDCNLDMTENVLKDRGEGVKTMVFSYLRKESLAKCLLCQTSVQCARSVYLHLNSTEKRQERVTCQHTDLEIEKRGWGCFWEDFKQCI